MNFRLAVRSVAHITVDVVYFNASLMALFDCHIRWLLYFFHKKHPESQLSQSKALVANLVDFSG